MHEEQLSARCTSDIISTALNLAMNGCNGDRGSPSARRAMILPTVKQVCSILSTSVNQQRQNLRQK